MTDACRACPRLVAHRDAIASRHPGYHCQPVLPWGARDARCLIVGLAPGLHGANRTGRPFTGDDSGVFLFAALARAGWVSDADPARARLNGIRITNAVRCLPPGNRPVAAEVRTCNANLRRDIDALWRPGVRRPRCIVALGRIAHDAVGLALGRRLEPFRHGALQQVAPRLWLADTYHPSRQNTNTGRLTAPMLDEVLAAVDNLANGGRVSL